MNYHFGIVEDNNDSEQLGRARVRVYGIHTHNKDFIPTDALPWATVLQPVTSAANSGIGITPNLKNGTQVMVSFLDPEDMQFPIILGTVASHITKSIMNVDGVEVERFENNFGFQDPKQQLPTKDYVGDNDLPKLARSTENEFERTQHTSSNRLFDIEEPEDIRSKHQYPHNQVRQSMSGHYEEWDDTPENERINEQHKSGTFREIRPDGTVVEKIVKDNYTIVTENNNVYVEGVCNLHINSTCNTYIKGDWNIQVDGSVDWDIGKTLDMDVGESIFQDAQTIHLNRDMGGEMGAARIDDTADTGDAGTGSHFDTNSAGTDKIETGSGTVFIGD